MNSVFDFFLPRICPGCKSKLLPSEEIICNKCKQQISPASNERLISEFNKKFFQDDIISDFISTFVFEKDKPLQYLIHELKYSQRFRVGLFLGREIANRLGEKISVWNADFIVPVPLHHLKKADRGYNQSYFISKGISKELNIPVKQNILKRKKYTATQTLLSAKERKRNIASAFVVKNKKKIENATVILVDDVITTGATITECGKTLITCGAKKIYALSAAIAD